MNSLTENDYVARSVVKYDTATRMQVVGWLEYNFGARETSTSSYQTWRVRKHMAQEDGFLRMIVVDFTSHKQKTIFDLYWATYCDISDSKEQFVTRELARRQREIHAWGAAAGSGKSYWHNQQTIGRIKREKPTEADGVWPIVVFKNKF